jgi:SAM-dependent methyltransferase
MNISSQIENGYLVCPKTKQKLILNENVLQTPDGAYSYSMIQDVPFFINPGQFGGEDTPMAAEYNKKPKNTLFTKFNNSFRAWFGKDFRSPHCSQVINKLLADLPKNHLSISVGGGPTRIHHEITNININRFPGVDIVADAHELPYEDNSVDFIYCEAVLEHLQHPQKSVAEMHRVLRPGGKVFAITPFLQPYHGYPFHFQNFTLQGHRQLFEDAGLSVLHSGTCVGPGFMISQLSLVYLKYLPKPIRLLIWPFVMAFARLVLWPLDSRLTLREDSHIGASTTFVAAVKH